MKNFWKKWLSGFFQAKPAHHRYILSSHPLSRIIDNLMHIPSFARLRSSQGQLFRPKGIALTRDERILVSDSYLGVIQIYKNDTRFSGVLAAGDDIARFTTPVGMAVDSKNRVYVAESMANRVSVCQLAP